METRSIKDSTVTLSFIAQAQHANLAGNVHGGVIMKYIDEAGGMTSLRHCKGNVVTASIDRMNFHNPAFIGDMITFKASINLVGKTSMEVGVRAESENPVSGERRHIASAYLTYVALGPDLKPVPIPPVKIETEVEKRRNREASDRRSARLAERRKEKACQDDVRECGI